LGRHKVGGGDGGGTGNSDGGKCGVREGGAGEGGINGGEDAGGKGDRTGVGEGAHGKGSRIGGDEGGSKVGPCFDGVLDVLLSAGASPAIEPCDAAPWHTGAQALAAAPIEDEEFPKQGGSGWYGEN
jgi:hypothetical protein